MAHEEKHHAGKKPIHYHKESVYGVHKNYYNDPEVAHHMHAITGKKTLDDAHIEHLKAMGHEVREVPVQASQMQTGKGAQPLPVSRPRGTSSGYMVGQPSTNDDNAAIN